jgi:3',5'-cyclic AMP phosphodiesterase CpdA
MVICKGNHDGEYPMALAYTDPPFQRMDWFSFQIGRVEVFTLDTNCDPLACPQQTKWLKEKLAVYSDSVDFRIVVLHLPPFSELWDPNEEYNGESYVREEWVPLFEQHNVSLVVSGHSHTYARGKRNGVMYAIIGGGGGVLDKDKVYDWNMFEVANSQYHYVHLLTKGRTLVWRAYSTYGHIIDEFTLFPTV